MTSPLADPDRALIREAARAAGEVLADFFRSGAEAWEKSRGNPVTEADLAAEKTLESLLKSARPDYGWLSEESVDDGSRLTAQRSFVIDPMDGTRAFIKGKPHFTVSIGVVENGRPVAGAIFNPITSEMFDAAKGEGATLNGDAIHTSEHATLAGARLLGDPHLSRGLLEQGATIESRNSIAYRIALVAAGQFDASVSPRPKSDWDLAAADIIMSEAGGLLTDHAGQVYRYNTDSVLCRPPLAAGPRLHALLRDRLQNTA
ncbi:MULTISPECIES: inositol monophosphatase family protein [Hyphobacterium]|uniref:Inositol monophosphatase family protein n=1 Tax=Hyphobacterium vulgare TaxID=1736751 RepID=A0ABV6ZYP6_9PROT